MQSRVCRRSCYMLAISRPAVALPSASVSMAPAAAAPSCSNGQAALTIRWHSI